MHVMCTACAACGMRHAHACDACVVDEHIAAAVPGHERLGKGIRARSVAHLQRHVLGAPTDLRRRMLAASGIAAAQHDDAEEAAVHEALRDVVADSLVGAGHNGDASGDHCPSAILVYAPSRHRLARALLVGRPLPLPAFLLMAAVHDDVYEVERLVDVRSRKKRTQYLVRWVGWAPEHDSWEDEASIHTAELIVQFNRERLSHRKRDTHAVEVEVVEVWPDDDSGVLTVDAVVVDDAAAGARDMTAEEAVAQAAQEGLVLVTNHGRNVTGYFGLHFDNRAQSVKRPYSVYLEADTTSGIYKKARPQTLLGTFATAEQAALVYARRTDNRAERIIADIGRAEGSRKALAEANGHTVVCRRCQGLVDLQCARRGKRAGALFAMGDGCYRCSPCCRPGRLRRNQTNMAQAVQLGKRKLVAWPKTSESRVAVQVLSPEEAAAMVCAALGALVPEETRVRKSAPRAPSAQGLEETPARRSERSGKARALWLED